MRRGNIIPNGVVLEKHEYKTILLFTEMEKDVELIPRSKTSGVHTLISKNGRILDFVKE